MWVGNLIIYSITFWETKKWDLTNLSQLQSVEMYIAPLEQWTIIK